VSKGDIQRITSISTEAKVTDPKVDLGDSIGATDNFFTGKGAFPHRREEWEHEEPAQQVPP
jgi:hypothetical protein